MCTYGCACGWLHASSYLHGYAHTATDLCVCIYLCGPARSPGGSPCPPAEVRGEEKAEGCSEQRSGMLLWEAGVL